jgi:hypothetical protein
MALSTATTGGHLVGEVDRPHAPMLINMRASLTFSRIRKEVS